MRNRQPADQRMDPYHNRTGGTMARSPSERLEPTRPPARPRRRKDSREPRRTRPFLRFLNGLLTFVLLLMLLVGVGAFVLRQPDRCARSARTGQDGRDPQGRGHARDRLAARARGHHHRPPAVHCRLPVDQARGGSRRQQAGAAQGRRLRGEAERQRAPGDRPAFRRQDHDLPGHDPGGPHQLPDRRAAEGGCQPRRRDRGRAAGGLAAARDLRHRARHAAPGRRRPHAGRSPQGDREGLGAAQEGPAASSRRRRPSCWPRSWRRRRDAATSATAWRPCSSTGCGRTCGCSPTPPSCTGSRGGKTVWSRPIQKNEIGQKTSHNTYQIDGLPPTPICNPGRAAIEAVLNPADTKELYFVADGAGGHVFSETLKDHNANVQKWRAAEKDIEGQGGRRQPPTRRPRPRQLPHPRQDPRRRPHRAAGQGAGSPPRPRSRPHPTPRPNAEWRLQAERLSPAQPSNAVLSLSKHARSPRPPFDRLRARSRLHLASGAIASQSPARRLEPAVGRASLFLNCSATTVRGRSSPRIGAPLATQGASRGIGSMLEALT